MDWRMRALLSNRIDLIMPQKNHRFQISVSENGEGGFIFFGKTYPGNTSFHSCRVLRL
jgi:hypothetical protein